MKGTLIHNNTFLPYTLKFYGLDVTLVGYNIRLGKFTSEYFWSEEAAHASCQDSLILENNHYRSYVERFVKGGRNFYRIVSVELDTGKGIHTSYFY